MKNSSFDALHKHVWPVQSNTVPTFCPTVGLFPLP